MRVGQTAFGALAVAACLCGTSVSAGNGDDAQALIESLLNFDRPDHPEVQAASTTFTGCEFRIESTFSESGSTMIGTMWGDISEISPDNITRQPGDPVETMRFRRSEYSSAWGANFEVGPQHPLFTQLTDDPTSVEWMVGDCSDSICIGTVELPTHWTRYDYTFGLTDLVTDAEADQLLAAFQNLADLCTAQAQ